MSGTRDATLPPLIARLGHAGSNQGVRYHKSGS